MKLFVGLGTPGSKYEKTRHNAGFMVIDELSKAWNIHLSEEKKFKGEIGRGVVKGEKNILFINLNWGLGLSIFINGELYYGKSGFSGEHAVIHI